ncbi:MAG: hypothetical protein GYA57_05650 [Myxococcales bacterium]|nr:hypothetical protein [Myxococcales bacterium]
MKKILVLACFGTALAVVGCGDDDSGDPCQGVAETDLCETAGDLQCSTDGTRVQSCAADANGCLVWTSTTTCGTNQTCVATGDTPVCECADDCTAGESECRGSVVWACEADADGCLVWARGDDCAATDESCVETGTTAECSSTCTPDCTTAGETQCDGTVIQTCADVGGGCLQWQDGEDCADSSEICDDTAEPAVCVAGCTPTCSDEGATQCSGTVIQTCTDVGGCLLWQDGTDCADTSRICDDTAEPAVCTETCTPTCTTAGDTQCNTAGDAIETCTDVDGCLLWQETADCAAMSQVCDDTGGTPVCVEPCVSDCTTAGDTQCTGTVIDTCTDVGGGCLQWVAGTDCATTADYCDLVGGTATCLTCTDVCTTAGETQCNGTVIETCTADAHGCLDWAAGTDCAATSQECDDGTEPAVCVDRGAGSCASPIVVRSGHYAVAGTDFTADFTNDQTLGGTDCVTRTGSVEAVFSIDLLAGETVRLRELGSLDAVLSLQNTCGDTEACVFAEDSGETTGYDYTATTDETVYLIVEAWFVAPMDRAYDIRIDVVGAEDCGNGTDDDLDGDIDCDDDDCFGDATDCAAETNCADGADNDADGSTDCDDSDCGAVPACSPYRAVYEAFLHPSDPFDLEGRVLTFTPSATDPMGYTWTVADGTGGYLVAPGSGTTTATLTLADDSNVAHAFSTMAAGFPFFGTTYHGVYVGSNGYLTLGSGIDTIVDTPAEFFAQPIIAALAADLNPRTSGAAVTVDEFADQVAVTFHDVPFYGETALNQFQVVLHSDGRIQFVYVAAPAAGFESGDTPYVGIASGVGRTPYPAETNFYVAPVAAAGDVIVTEILYDPNAVADPDGEWFEIYNPTSRLLNLEGVVFSDLNTPPDRFTVTGRLLIGPGQYLVFGRNGNPATNGGVTVDYVYPSGFNLANTDDEIIITAGTVEIDRVTWNEAGTPPWPAATGASIQLNPLRYGADNNDPANWCLATAAFGAGDRGTPGAANSPCIGAVYFSADLETNPGWTICGGGTPCDWQWGTPSYASGPAACAGGTGCFGTNLTGNYANNSSFANNYVQAGPIDLSAATAAVLSFDMWLDTEANWDFARVEVSTNGTTFVPLTPVSPAYTHPTAAPTQWGSDFLTWTPVTADLTAYTGAGMSTVYLRWAFDSDSSYNYAGFYFDNVLVYAP